MNWHNHINDLAAKPNTKNALLFKSRNYVNQKILTAIWFAIFDSNLILLILFCLSVLMQFNELSYYKKSNQNNIIPVSKLSSVPFFRKKNYILKISEKVMIDNVLFFIKTTNNIPPSVLKNLFKLCYNFHHYSTSGLIIFESFQLP